MNNNYFFLISGIFEDSESYGAGLVILHAPNLLIIPHPHLQALKRGESWDVWV
jgi:hypothetical protein